MKWTREDIKEQKNKTVIVTGANSGLGFETTRVLASKGATVIMACRDIQKAGTAEQKIMEDSPGAALEVMELNLASLASIRECAQGIAGRHKKLDILINNAGIMFPPFGKTEDGFEQQFGTNHLGHFALTGRLFGLLAATEGARIVTVSSLRHKSGKMDFGNLNAENGYDRSAAYGLSKLANLMFTYELQRRIDAAGLKMMALAAHPGWTGTNLQRYESMARFLNPVFAQKPEMGVLPSLYAATSPDAEAGAFYGPGGLSEIWGYPKKVSSIPASHDEEAARRLWERSVEMTGVSFPGI